MLFLNKDDENKASFYVLQIKPLIGNATDYNVDMEKIRKEEILLYSEKEMGNGMMDDIDEVVFVDPDTFDKSKTMEMADEMDPLALEGAVARAMSRGAKVEVHNDTTMVVKLAEE